MPKLLREQIVGELGLPDDRVLGIDEGIVVQHEAVTVTAVPAAHEFLDEDPATGLHPYLGFIMEGNGFRLYHAGDTCLYEGMQAKLRRWPLDLALLPINGRDAKRLAANCIGNMTYQEAADLAGAIRPRTDGPHALRHVRRSIARTRSCFWTTCESNIRTWPRASRGMASDITASS